LALPYPLHHDHEISAGGVDPAAQFEGVKPAAVLLRAEQTLGDLAAWEELAPAKLHGLI
jgi:hypothetical protein